MFCWHNFSRKIESIISTVLWITSGAVWVPATYSADIPPVAVPIDIVFSIDSSGSMGPVPPKQRLEELARARKTTPEELAGWFAKDIERRRVQAVEGSLDSLQSASSNSMQAAVYQVGLISWDDNVDFQVPLTSNFQTIRDKLKDIDSDGGTNLKRGLEEAIRQLENSQRSYAKKVVIFLTDGMASKPAWNIDSALQERAKEREIIVYTIGLDVPEEAKETLEAIANITGGRYFPAQEAAYLQTIFNEILEQVANVFLDIQMEKVSVTAGPGQSVDVRFNLHDGTGRTLAPLRDLTVSLKALRSSSTKDDQPKKLINQNLIIRRGSMFASTSIDGLDKAGLIFISAAVKDYPRLVNQTTLVLDKPGPPPEKRVNFHLLLDRMSVPVGNRLQIRALALDEDGSPVQVTQEYDLIFHLRPIDLKLDENQRTVQSTVVSQESSLISSAWAQSDITSYDIKENGQFFDLSKGIYDFKARLLKNKSIIYFTIGSSDPWVFSISLEVPLIGFIGNKILGAIGIKNKPERIHIWVQKKQLLADNQDKTSLTLVLVGRKDEKAVPVCMKNQTEKIKVTTSLGSIENGRIQPPPDGCQAIIFARDLVLKAGYKPGDAVVRAFTEKTNFFGLEEIKFLFIQPGWQLLLAAFGGCLGALLAEFRRLEGRRHNRIKFSDLVGPFLVSGMVIGFIFYIAVYYGAFGLSIPFSSQLVFAVLIGAVAGYFGPRTMEKLIPLFGLKRKGQAGKRSQGEEGLEGSQDIRRAKRRFE